MGQQGALTKERFFTERQHWLKALRAGAVAIVPTDTIYGLTGNALDEGVLRRIMEIKQRSKAFSLIPPDVAWAKQLIPMELRQTFAETCCHYYGPYTMLWPYDGDTALPPVLVATGKVGLRFPGHWIGEVAKELGFPLLTTSVNRSGEAPMTCLEDLPAAIAAVVDFIVYEGPLHSPPSQLVDCCGERPKILARLS